MYSRTHKMSYQSHRIHSANRIRIRVATGMCIIWNEALYHSGAKSLEGRTSMRFFSFVHPYVDGIERNKQPRSVQAIMKENGRQVYRDFINCFCSDCHNNSPRCLECENGELFIDLREVLEQSYTIGEVILGDIDLYGWVVIRGIKLKEATRQAFERVSREGRGIDGTWHSVERQANRQMKYTHSCQPSDLWNMDELSVFKTKITDKLLRKVFPGKMQYTLGKFNLLRNEGIIHEDQAPHSDYHHREPEY